MSTHVTIHFTGDVEDLGAEVGTEGDQDPGQRDLRGQDQGHDLAGPDRNGHELDPDPEHVGTENRGHARGLVDDQDLGRGEKSTQL